MSRSLLTIIGCGEAFDHDGLGNTSYLLQAKNDSSSSILFDCGYQIPERLWAKDLHTQIETIFVTHFHADHFFGVVPLLARYGEENRTKDLTVVAPAQTEKMVRSAMELGYPGILDRMSYQVNFIDHGGQEFDRGGFNFSFAKTTHSITNYGIRVQTPSSSFLISGDGKPSFEYIQLASTTNLVFQETYSYSNIPTHGSIQDLTQMLNETNASIGVTHISRAEKGSDKFIALTGKYPKRCFIVRPFMEFEV